MIENTITTNENLVQVFCGVRGYEEDGVAYLHIEDAARGLGFERTQNKDGVEYTSIRWATVEGHLQDFGFHQQVGESGNPHDYYIPENIFYRLCMKAKNEVAEKFQAKVADEIIPSIRKTGSYSITKPDSYMIEDKIERAKRWIEETEEWQKALSAEETAHAETKVLLAEEKEKVEYLERSKSWIGDKKVASAMGTAGALSKKCDRLEKELDKVKSETELQVYNAREAVRKEFEEAWTTARDWCYKHKLTVKINEPKWAVSAKLTKICEAHPDRDQWRRDARGTKLFPKWACDILDKVYDEDSMFLSEYRIE